MDESPKIQAFVVCLDFDFLRLCLPKKSPKGHFSRERCTHDKNKTAEVLSRQGQEKGVRED